MDVLCTFKIQIESQKFDHSCNKHQWPYPNQDQDAKPSQDSPASSKAQNEDLKDMDVLCTLKINMESQNFEQRYIKTHDNIQIMIKMPNSSLEPPASSKAPIQNFKDMDVLCTFKIKIESQNLEHWYIKTHQPYPNQDQDAKPQPGTSSIL